MQRKIGWEIPTSYYVEITGTSYDAPVMYQDQN